MKTSSPTSEPAEASAGRACEYPCHQAQRREQLYAAHRKTIDLYWNDVGKYIGQSKELLEFRGGYRAILWQCLAYLGGDARMVEKANRIILANFNQEPCHFTPGAATDVLYYYRDRLLPETVQKLERYLHLNLPYMTTEDLKIYGYNDNHPFKAIHALIVGGEMLGLPHLVEKGLQKLRGAVEVYERNGFPCEYNSPNYAPVSLQPLASIVEQAANAEARELALRVEHFFWQDVALHFDPAAGLPTGPMSRAGGNDYDGLLSGTLLLLLQLFPERFGIDLIHEVYEAPGQTPFITSYVKDELPFFQAHPVWFARATYHVTRELEAALFAPREGATVRGMAETGASSIEWKQENKRPEGAPLEHHLGPRRSLLTTYYGKGFSLGTAQYAWLDNTQAHGFYALVSRAPAKDGLPRPDHSAIYFARQFADEHYPYTPTPNGMGYLRDEGEIRTVQHENAAMVFYNPHPYDATVQRLRTGVFRPLMFTQPREVYVGEIPVPDLNLIHDQALPVALNEGTVYVGIIPLPLASLGQSRRAVLQLQTYSTHLAILISSGEFWGPRRLTYHESLEANSGFIFEIHPAADFASFAAFRQWLARARVEDTYYSRMRTTTYQREGLKLSSAYSPFHSAFRYVSVNNRALPQPILGIQGMPDPGYGLVK